MNYEIGDFKYSAINTDHQNWLLCDGRTLFCDQYPDLYNEIKNSYGKPSNETFKIPNCVNRTMAGINSSKNIGFLEGEEQVLLKKNNIPKHTHTGKTSINGIHNHNGKTNVFGSHNHGGNTTNDTGQVTINNENYYVNKHKHDFFPIDNVASTSTSDNMKILENTAVGNVKVIKFNHGIGTIYLDNTESIHKHDIDNDNYHNHYINVDNGHNHNIIMINNNNEILPHNNIQPTIYLGYTFIKFL